MNRISCNSLAAYLNVLPGIGNTTLYILSFQIEPAQDISLPPAQKYCSSHDGELIRYFCETCKITICPDCVILDTDHKDHKYTRLKDIAKEQAASLKDLAEQGREFEDKYKRCITETEQVENDLDITAQLAYSRLNKIEWSFKTHLDLILTGYKRRLNKQEISRGVVINHTKEELSKNLSKLQKSCDLAFKLAEAGTEFEIFANYANISSALQDCMLIKPKSIDVVLGNITMHGVESDASVAMALVADDYNHRYITSDHQEAGKTLSITRKQRADVEIFEANTFLKYILVAIFAILVYRVFCSLIGF